MTDDASDAPANGGEDEGDRGRALKAASKGWDKLHEIQAMFASVRHELAGSRFWRYQRQVSPGLQEYIEALGFAHYLETGKLIRFEDVQKTLSDEQGSPVRVLLIYSAEGRVHIVPSLGKRTVLSALLGRLSPGTF